MSYTREQLMSYALSRVDVGEAPDVVEADADIVVHLLDHCTVSVPAQNRFFVDVNCDDITRQVAARRQHVIHGELDAHGIRKEMSTLAYTGWHDFSHTSAVWEDVMALGIVGLRDRVVAYAQQAGEDASKQRFFGAMTRVWDAVLRFLARAADEADAADKPEMANGLRELTHHAPETLFEAMQTVIVYYVLQTMFDGTYLRTLGRLDKLFYLFYDENDRADTESLVDAFLAEIDRLRAPSNMPFAIGGTDTEGKTSVNEMTHILLDGYHRVPTNNTKLHLLVSEDMPRALVERALDGVRRGYNSIVFMSDAKVIESLVKLGEDRADAANYHVVGCYECGGDGELTCSCNARVNLPMALELALCGGKTMLTDAPVGLSNEGRFDTFEALFAEFERQATHLCERAMLSTGIHESYLAHLHASPILSATYKSALEKGADLYCGSGAKYNSSSLNAIGLGTAVDSLAAIRQLVYEDGALTLSELTEMLRSDWEGNEMLRLRAKNKLPKYGVGDAEVDALARDTVAFLTKTVSGKPNTKGGVWRLGTFSIYWRWEFGEKTGASADGRHAGDPISQNTGATFGADREGATAHLLSAAAIDMSDTPNGSIVDIDLHESAVRGDNGLRALTTSLLTYFDLGGFAVHYNVLDTETLKKAKKSPADYPNLQVRLCGWNVLFSNLSDKEKDEFIARSEHDGGGV